MSGRATGRGGAAGFDPGGAAGFDLACDPCALREPAWPDAGTCPRCGGPLLARYGPEPGSGARLAAAWTGRPPGVWRFAELLPLRAGERALTLGEGGTRLLPLPDAGRTLGLDLWCKDESGNPTGSFKDRGLAVAVTRAAHDGAAALALPSAGNAGCALAAYAAWAGLPARVFLPADTPAAVERRCRAYGAEVERVPGHIGDCGRRAADYARATGARDLSTLREPYRVEGKKTMMLEIVAALGWRAPDAIVYPTGGGTGLIGSWKALRELEAIGLVEARTRLYAVQAAGCAPIVRAHAAGAGRAEPWDDPVTAAWGLRVPSPFGGALVLGALRDSRGGAVAVEDSEMEEEAAALRRVGIPAGIEGGAALAGTRALRRLGRLAAGETVVLFNTGHARNT